MILEAELNNVHATINGLFTHPGVLAPFGLTLLLDTGASCSCLLRDHVYYFGIQHTTLNNAPGTTDTAAGRVTPKVLPRVDLYLPLRDSENDPVQLRRFHFDELQIMPPPRSHNPEPRHRVVSILGMDVLQQFTTWEWDWNTRKLVLSD